MGKMFFQKDNNNHHDSPKNRKLNNEKGFLTALDALISFVKDLQQQSKSLLKSFQKAFRAIEEERSAEKQKSDLATLKPIIAPPQKPQENNKGSLEKLSDFFTQFVENFSKAAFAASESAKKYIDKLDTTQTNKDHAKKLIDATLLPTPTEVPAILKAFDRIIVPESKIDRNKPSVLTPLADLLDDVHESVHEPVCVAYDAVLNAVEKRSSDDFLEELMSSLGFKFTYGQKMKTLQHLVDLDPVFHARELSNLASLKEIRVLGPQFNKSLEIIRESRNTAATPYDSIKNPTPRPF